MAGVGGPAEIDLASSRAGGFLSDMIHTIALIILSVATSLPGQRVMSLPFTFTGQIPEVRLNHSAVELQRALYPDHYQRFDARADVEWADDNDAALEEFLRVQGDTLLHLLSELSGIEWRERVLDFYVVRYFPSLGSPDPLVLPVGGMRRGELIEATPAGKVQKLNVIYQLARRMLDQPVSGSVAGMANHALMRPGIYRRDNLALLLAVTAAGQVMGADSARDAWQSAFWRNHFPGMEVFERYFAGKWALTPEKTLAQWVLAESPSSELIDATRPPQRSDRPDRPRAFVEGLPLKGDLGIAVSIHENGLLRVDELDPDRAAYAAGLREGDLIRTVDGARVQNHKQLAERVLERYEKGGATVQVIRNGNAQTFVLRPVARASESR